ncbi:(3R)-hydroxyacyl-ACP dehydratase subunit HadB [Rhodococcus sp. NPDC127528]|uniref:(3R)-hydroxyacyl-ACP dehydratase subunit HadB n=1 Tax=unclassified Rhodococcus (in: high G+C Gram-positive bacteria) TaxID=192944 RepID=UPI00362761C0
MALRAFGEIAEGQELPEKTVRLTRSDLVQYAGVAGDPNPIHWDDAVAQGVGLPTAVAHGMLTMGIGAGYITGWVGDPGAVLEYNVRFTSPVAVPNDTKGTAIVLTGKVRSVDSENRTAVIAIVAKVDEKKIFGRATATVRFG